MPSSILVDIQSIVVAGGQWIASVAVPLYSVVVRVMSNADMEQDKNVKFQNFRRQGPGKHDEGRGGAVLRPYNGPGVNLSRLESGGHQPLLQ